jgi:hypothetical protein
MVGERAGGRMPMRHSIGLESVDSSMEFVKVRIQEVCVMIRATVRGTIRKTVRGTGMIRTTVRCTIQQLWRPYGATVLPPYVASQ